MAEREGSNGDGPRGDSASGDGTNGRRSSEDDSSGNASRTGASSGDETGGTSAGPDETRRDESGPVESKGNQGAVIGSAAACVSVDAGAGTGKTTTMLMRIDRAIESGAVDPEDVLVLTFANEAAASVREHVTRRLDPEAAYAIDVSTYHSFCYRLVREYAYYLGFSPEFDVVTDRERRRIVTRLLAERDYGFAATTGDGTAADLAGEVTSFVEHLSRENVDPATLEAELPDVRTLELLSEFVLWLEREADEKLTFENEALRYFNRERHREEARESLVEFGKLLSFCREKIAEAPEPFREDDVVRDVDRYFRVLQSCVTAADDALDLEDGPSKHLPRALFADETRGTTGRIEQTPVGRLARYVEFLRLARHYATVYADYREHLERERSVDFDALVRRATDLLTDEAVADEITDRWEQVYCDEFQDTDGTQFDLIARLTDSPERPDLLAIGDRDQSIYGWRGTDRDGLDRLAAVHDDHERYDLELNFRSKAEILELTNRCDYGPQSSKTLREEGREAGEREPGSPPRVLRIDSDEVPLETPAQVGTTVARLLDGDLGGVPERSPGDVAVIVRTNRHARAVAADLRDRRIPFERSGSTGGEISPGVRTVLSYLRAVVDPAADAHLRRVLLYRYRVPEGDLERLHARDGTLREALAAIDPAAFEAADRLERARDHLETLSTLRRVSPLPAFFRRFRELTRCEWFLTGEERETVERIERLLAASDPDDVLATLTTEVVAALERSLGGDGATFARGERSADRVDVMTVHQAKGLQFDTVLAPFLSDEEWCVERDYARRARYGLLLATVDDEVDSPLTADLASDRLAEEWRVLHVALTRAENHLFLFGSPYDYEGGPDDLGVGTVDDCLADEIDWSAAGVRMDLWETLTESFESLRDTYPETVVDVTNDLAAATDATPGTVTYEAREARERRNPVNAGPPGTGGAGDANETAGTLEADGADGETRDPTEADVGDGEGDAGEALETDEAIETVHRLGRLLREGTLLPAADAISHAGAMGEGARTPTGRRAGALTADTVRFPVETLSSADEPALALRHSHSSVRAHGECARKHYLDHVVRAIGDPTASAAEGARVVGTLFHDVAEEAFHRDYRGREAWRRAADRQATARELTEHREAVLACVDRYFEATADGRPVHEWAQLAAELPFALEDVPGVDGEVIGYVDSVRRTPDGDLVVLDYKATADRIDPADAAQLRLYLRACRRRFDEPVAAAGYVYVGEAGPAVDLFAPDELPSWASVRRALEAADDPAFDDATPGDHCRYCPHRSFDCAPEEYSPALETADDD